MPRFGIKTLLITFFVSALWLSTFAGYGASADVRGAVMLVILLSAVFAAVYFAGPQRAFWAGFAAVMLLSCFGRAIRQYFTYLPQFGWPDTVARTLTSNNQSNSVLNLAIYSTIREAFNLILAVIVGRIAVYIYDQSRRSVPHNRV
jgi:hypothetical protein